MRQVGLDCQLGSPLDGAVDRDRLGQVVPDRQVRLSFPGTDQGLGLRQRPEAPGDRVDAVADVHVHALKCLFGQPETGIALESGNEDGHGHAVNAVPIQEALRVHQACLDILR